MKLDYRKETATMLKALRKAGYDNQLLRREKYLKECVRGDYIVLQTYEEPQ